MTATLGEHDTTRGEVLYMALELSASKWRLAFAAEGGERLRQVVVTAGDLAALTRAIAQAKAKLGLAPAAAVRSVYEAGRDGFWLQRWLTAQGIDNRVIDASSVEARVGRKRRKTDRLDAALLLRKLRAWWGGDRRVFAVVQVPPQVDRGPAAPRARAARAPAQGGARATAAGFRRVAWRLEGHGQRAPRARPRGQLARLRRLGRHRPCPSASSASSSARRRAWRRSTSSCARSRPSSGAWRARPPTRRWRSSTGAGAAQGHRDNERLGARRRDVRLARVCQPPRGRRLRGADADAV
ncbi:MAG: hypothetical protein U5K43_15195 [Halofilum sp. (in: g-proteobacteria)]|nr:hypothetical protein [Halofilum sp. (in: g-proteobacteria)]